MDKFSYGKDYLKNLSTLLRHDDFIEGQSSSVHKYLIRHLSEYSKAIEKQSGLPVGDLSFQIRSERMENNNLCDTILTYWLGYLSLEMSFKDYIKEEPWPTILEDMDGEELDIKTFSRDQFWDYLGYGMFCCLIEGPSGITNDKQAARLSGERAYATIWEPYRVCKLERFKSFGAKKGQLREVCLVEEVGHDESKNPYSISAGYGLKTKERTINLSDSK